MHWSPLGEASHFNLHFFANEILMVFFFGVVMKGAEKAFGWVPEMGPLPADALAAARVTGALGARQTSRLLPFCHDVLLQDTPLEDCIEPVAVKNLFVAPSSLDLAGAEIELVAVFSREMRLKNAISSVADDFDYVLIDCPPSLGLLTVNALAAANEVCVPIQCEYYALEGLSALLQSHFSRGNDCHL